MAAESTPHLVLSPGEALQRLITERGWNQYDLAEILGTQQSVVSSLVNNKRPMTVEIARALSAVFGTDPAYWLNLDVQFRLFSTQPSDDTILRRARLFAIAPVKDMIKRRWIQGALDTEILEKQVLGFYGASSLEDVATPSHAARKSSSYAQTSPSERAWMHKVRTLARMVSANEFVERNLPELLSRLKGLMLNPESVRHIPKILAAAGIRFVVVEPLPKTRIDGVCLWLDKTSPVIGLSLRINQLDSVWFSLLHELGHVNNRDGLTTPAVIDSDLAGEHAIPTESKPTAEREADAFAQAALVSPAELDNFIARIKPLYSNLRIKGFASRLGVHPSIVLGQLQHRGEIDWSHSRDFQVKVRETLTTSALTDGWGQSLPAAS